MGNEPSNFERNTTKKIQLNLPPGNSYLKIVICGGKDSGKTSFCRKLTKGIFSLKKPVAENVELSLKTIPWSDTSYIHLQFWDLSSIEEKGNKTRLFYENSSAAFIFCDITNSQSIEDAKRWKVDYDNKTSKKNPVVLISNKHDIPHNPLNDTKLKEFMFQYSFSGHYAISVKNNESFDEPIIHILNQLFAPNLESTEGN
eukprot:TRINITY_DN8952_c0_g1_i1.p1 TRINITY_DN8952_c0_g1~~TRINITY_DN8952_c0_g1_i1.p1  ORF type:complete len:200 (-),score=47.24 TRINITY_DN8952_c0_g1_i1:43-642(-)